MKIDVNEQTVEQFFDLSKTTLVVPDYQRPYSWGVSQWSDFWEDLDSLGQNETHFLGAIVLIAGMFNPGEFNELELVDGQQRLVTISIFLKVVQDLYEEAGNSQMAKEIEVYLFSKMLGKERKIRLRLGKADRDVYENLIMGRLELIQGKTIYKAYSFFKNILKDHKDLDDISKKLIDNLSFVAITTHDERSAYRLFETLNDRGLDLSAVDLIKNHLLRIVSESGGNTTEFVKNNWEGMIGNLEDIDKVRYFRHYLMSSSFCVLKGKITKDGLYDKFCNTLKKMEDIQGFVEDINRQSYLYGQLVNYRTDIFDQGRNEAINEHLRNLVAIKATTSYTFLLKIFTKLKKAEDIIKILKLIEVFAMRRIIVGVSTADLDLIYNTLAMTDFKSDHWFGDIRSHLIKNMPKDSEFLEKFKTAQFQESDQTKYILDKLEIETYNTANEGIKVRNRFSVHIEHIAPKTMSNVNDWQGFAKLDDETRKEYITSIGNLTLLEKRPNIKASNNPFDEKKQFYTEKNTSMRMTQDLLKYDEWGVDAIERRSGKLAEKALKIWHFDEK